MIMMYILFKHLPTMQTCWWVTH